MAIPSMTGATPEEHGAAATVNIRFPTSADRNRLRAAQGAPGDAVAFRHRRGQSAPVSKRQSQPQAPEDYKGSTEDSTQVLSTVIADPHASVVSSGAEAGLGKSGAVAQHNDTSANWSWAPGSAHNHFLAELQAAAEALQEAKTNTPDQVEAMQKEISAQALSLVSLVNQAKDSAVLSGQSSAQALDFQRSVLSAVAGLGDFAKHPGTSGRGGAVMSRPNTAYLPPKAIVRPPSAASEDPSSMAVSSPMLRNLAALPRPQSSPAASQPTQDTSEILRIEHLPEWQAQIAAWYNHTDEAAKEAEKPKGPKPLHTRWKSAGRQISFMRAFHKSPSANAKFSESSEARSETSLDDADLLMDQRTEEKQLPGYGLRTAVVSGFEVSNPLRRVDDLLEQARSELGVIASDFHASAPAQQTGAHEGEHADAAEGGLDWERSSGSASGQLLVRVQQVADLLGQVAEASAVVKGDVLGKLSKERARNTELYDDKQRLMKESYTKGARVHHLESRLKVATERNGGLIDQAESAKASKFAAEKRMHGLEEHVAQLEEKLSRYRSKLDGQLKEHMKVWKGKVEEHDALQEEHSRLQADHTSTVKEFEIKRKQAQELQLELDEAKGVMENSIDREKAYRADIKKLKDEIAAFRDLRSAQDAAVAAGKAREMETCSVLADRDLQIIDLQHQIRTSQQEINDQKRANEIARADMEKAKSDLRTCKSHLEESQSEVRKLESANQRLADEAETARADRDEARGKVTHLMDESAEARVGFEKSQKKQKLLEARSTAATKRCDALEHRSKQQAAALENARTKRLAAEVEVSETDERCEALAGRLLAAEAAAADARERAANMAHMRDTLYDEACAARDDSIAARSELKEAREKVKISEVASLKTRHELKAALVAVNTLTDEKMSLTEMLQKVLENIERLRLENIDLTKTVAEQKERISELQDEVAAVEVELQRLRPFEQEVNKLEEQQAELLDRNRLLEQLREDLSARLAKQQDTLNDLRAAGDKLVALAGAAASECALTQKTSRDAELAALEHISQIRKAMTDVVDSRLVLPGAVIGALAGQKESEPEARQAEEHASNYGSDAGRRSTHDSKDSEYPPGAIDSTEGMPNGHEGDENRHGGENETTIEPVKLPEGLDTAVVTEILEQEKAKKELQTAEEVAKVATAFDGLRCILADTCVAAHSRAVTAAASAEEHVLVLEELHAAMKSASALLDAQDEPAIQSARYLTTMVESNTVLGSGLQRLVHSWQNTSFIRPASESPLEPQTGPTAATLASEGSSSDTARNRPGSRSVTALPAQEPKQNAMDTRHTVTVRVPCAQTGTPVASQSGIFDSTEPAELELNQSPENAEVSASATEQQQQLLTRGRELRDISGIMNKMLHQSQDPAVQSSWAPEQQLVHHPDWIQSRRLGLSIDPEQLALEDERSAAQSYAAMIAREEALATAARTVGQREAQALAAAAAAESETEAARLELVRLHEVAENMREERDKARTSADNAQQQRLLIEHYSKVLAERLLRQQTAVNAAAAATGRDLSYISIATQTSESVLSCTVRTADTAQHSSTPDQQQDEAYAGTYTSAVPQGEIQGGEMAAALKSRDMEAFQMLLDALHQLPRQWLLSLPTRLLRVLAGEGFTLGAATHPSAPSAAPQGEAANAIESPQLSPEQSIHTTPTSTAPIMSTTTSVDAPGPSTGRMRVNRKAELTTKPAAPKPKPQSPQPPKSPGKCTKSKAPEASEDDSHDHTELEPKADSSAGTSRHSDSVVVSELLQNEEICDDGGTGASLLLSMETLDDPTVMNGADTAMLAHHNIDPTSAPIPEDLELQAGGSTQARLVPTDSIGLRHLSVPDSIPESQGEHVQEETCADNEPSSGPTFAHSTQSESLDRPSSSLGPSQLSSEPSASNLGTPATLENGELQKMNSGISPALQTSTESSTSSQPDATGPPAPHTDNTPHTAEDPPSQQLEEAGGVDMLRLPSRKTVHFNTAPDESRFSTTSVDDHDEAASHSSQTSQQSVLQQPAVQSAAALAQEQEELKHHAEHQHSSKASAASTRQPQAAGSAATAAQPQPGHATSVPCSSTLSEAVGTTLLAPSSSALVADHPPPTTQSGSSPAILEQSTSLSSTHTTILACLASSATPKHTKRLYNLSASAANRSTKPHILSSSTLDQSPSLNSQNRQHQAPDQQGRTTQGQRTGHTTAAELRNILPELPSLSNSLQLQSLPEPSAGMVGASSATQRPISALARAFVGTTQGSGGARTAGNSATGTGHSRIAPHRQQQQQNATQQHPQQRTPKSMGSVAIRATQSARGAQVPRSAIVDRARLIHDELHHGVWDAQGPTERSRPEQVAAAVDNNIRRAGRSATTPSGATPTATLGQSNRRPSTATSATPSASPSFSPTRNTASSPTNHPDSRLSVSSRRPQSSHEITVPSSMSTLQHMHGSAPVATPRATPRLLQRFASRSRDSPADVAGSHNAAATIHQGNNNHPHSSAVPVMQQSVYGHSVPQLVESEHDVSLRNHTNLDVATRGSDSQPDAVQQRLVLRDIPPNTFAPSGAATATTALVATPGGAAALCAIQRGAVPQALSEIGFQLGILVSSAGAQNTPESSNPSAHMFGVSRKGQIALDMLLLDVCKTMGCSTIPWLYIRPDAVARAYFLALPRDLPESSIPEGFPEALRPLSWALHPTFVITSEVLELLDREELRALFGSLLAFSMAPGGCGFDASSSENILELSAPLLDALGAATNPSTSPDTQFARRSTRGRTRSILHDTSAAADPGTDFDDTTYATTTLRRASTRRRASTSPSRMHASGPRLSTAPAYSSLALRDATIAAAATAAALQELTPGLLATIGVGCEERQWKARSGWASGGLEAMIRRAVPLLRMASDRGAILACQDVRVVERMIVKMECGSASLVRHISLPSLRNDAQCLLANSSPDWPIGSHLMHSQSPARNFEDLAVTITSDTGVGVGASTGRCGTEFAARHSVLNLNDSLNHPGEGSRQARRSTITARGARTTASASPSMRAAFSSAARPSGVNFSGNFGGNTPDMSALSDYASHGNSTVLRLAALHRWVASSEYENILTKNSVPP